MYVSSHYKLKPAVQKLCAIMNRTIHWNATHYLENADFMLDTLTLILTLIANSTLLAMEARVWLRRKRLSQPKLLIIFLAQVDIVLALLSILPRMWIRNIRPCLNKADISVYMLSRFCVGCFLTLSKLTVVLMGIERCISIRTPFVYVRKCTVRSFCVVQLLLLIYSILIGSVTVSFDHRLFHDMLKTSKEFSEFTCNNLFLSFEYGIHSSNIYMAWIHSGSVIHHYRILSSGLIIQDFVLVTVLLICNLAVIGGLSAMERRLRVSCPRPRDELSNEVDKMAVTGREFSRLMMAIIIVFIVVITPHMVRTLCNQMNVLASDLADFVCRRIALSSTFINPFLYGLLRRKVRRRILYHVIRVLTCCRPITIIPLDALQGSDSQTRLANLSLIRKFKIQAMKQTGIENLDIAKLKTISALPAEKDNRDDQSVLANNTCDQQYACRTQSSFSQLKRSSSLTTYSQCNCAEFMCSCGHDNALCIRSKSAEPNRRSTARTDITTTLTSATLLPGCILLVQPSS